MTKDNLPIPLPEQKSALSLRRTNQLIEVTDKILARSREEIAVQATTPTTSNPIIRLTTEGLLDQARQTQLQQARFRIGDYELREPDYRQILRWAEAAGREPEEVLRVLNQRERRLIEDAVFFRLHDGAIVELDWNFGCLPFIPETWEPGLRIRILKFRGSWPETSVTLRPILPELATLSCDVCHCASLDLSPVPGLTKLDCRGNSLTELDLSPVPGLTKLDCGFNQLTELDLSPVPGLTELGCAANALTELDLSPVPGLTKLDCRGTQLTELDLSPVPGLTKLECSSNELTELDLSPVPGLTDLNCRANDLTVLDLSPVPGLTELDCSWNKLTELDLLPVPGLTNLSCMKDVKVRNAPPHLSIFRE